MARKPNYDFEKKERERLKNAKKAARAEEKARASEGQTEPTRDEAERTDSAES
jgi:hypothetical protein